tara:strand:- start:60 stop:215 length:156 start_codon:yes stop_codon:yes gene_type:complete
MGLGSSAIACAELGLDFIGIELDPDYLEEAVSRVREAVSKQEKRICTDSQR